MVQLKVLELFSGTGSQTQALKNLGIDHISTQCEIDKYAVDTYNQLHGQTQNLGDITKVNPDDLHQGQWDLITYSFPCQSISLAGKQEGLGKGTGTESSLLWECEKIIRKVKPKWLLMENVKNLLSEKFKPQFDLWLKLLREMGYSNYYQVLNSKDFGIPQNRERVFCVSILGKDNYFEFPQKQELKLRLKDMLEDSPNEKYYLKKEIQDKFIMNDSNKEDIVSCAMRGRYNENGNVEQQIELNSEQVANCSITTVQKDNLVIEPKNPLKGKTEYGWHFEQQVYDANGIVRTIKAGGGSGNIPKVMEEPKIDRIGGMYGQATRWGVYNKEGISPTIVASMGEGGGHVPMITTEPQIEELGKLETKGFECCKRVYGTQGISPTVTAMGGDHVHKIVEPINVEKDGTAHTIKSQYAKTSVANFTKQGTFAATGVIERLSSQAYETLAENECKDGDIINPFNKKVTTDGICPTITTRPEGFKTANLVVVDDRQGKLFDMEETVSEKEIKVDASCYNKVAQNFEREKNAIANSNKDIYYTECESGFQDNRVGLKISPTVRAENDACFALDNHFRIRKLTPRECWRLMGWKDEQFDKVKGISNAQLYKQAGNGIVVNVLEAIFRQMFLVKYDKKDMSITGEQLDLF